MKVRNFILLTNILVIAFIFILFENLYLKQKQELSSIIISRLKDDLMDSNFIVKKYLYKEGNIIYIRPFLDKKVLQNKFIKSFILTKDNKILLISGDLNAKIPPDYLIKNNINSLKPKDLLEKEAFKIPIVLYDNGKTIKYYLYIILNKNEINYLFGVLKFKYLFLFLIVIFTLLLIINYLINKFITKPLLEIEGFINNYDNKNSNKLSVFFIKELESIKNAIKTSFEKQEKIIDNLYQISMSDNLTKVGNRQFLKKSIKQLIDYNRDKFCLVFLDLDNFKEINDFYGHDIGDKLIIEISELLKRYINSNEIVTRVGGDEFVLILKNCINKEKLKNRLNKLLEIVSKSWDIDGNEINISSSIGVTIFPDDASTYEELLLHADIAMYQAKMKGKNKVEFFNKELKNKLKEEYKIKRELKKALLNNEFVLFFQPKIDKNKKIVGTEALIRWIKDNKIISPGNFIPIAEKSGIIKDIGNWVMEKSFETLKEWENDEILKNISLAFNVSVIQFKDDNFLQNFEDLIKKFNIDTEKIEIEITESIFIEDKKRAHNILNKLHQFGIKINLDDFGTGYSSLSVLNEFNIDILKIDKSFIDSIDDENNSIFVKTIVDMAKNLNIKTVAEGIETQKQFEILREYDVDYYQGYLFSKPLAKDEFKKLVYSSNFKTQ